MGTSTENDQNFEHSTEVKSIYDICLKEILDDRKLKTRQPALNGFFKKKADHYLENETQPINQNTMLAFTHYTYVTMNFK
jgi:hypothetical protein